MRKFMLWGVILLGLSVTAAVAGEGNGNPFPGPDAAVTTRVGPHPYVAKAQDPFQFHAAEALTRMGRGYHAMASRTQDPFPFQGNAEVVGSTSNALAGNQAPTATGVTQQAAPPHG